MISVARLSLILIGFVALGASPQPHAARTAGTRPARPTFVDRTKYDRFAPNAIRRARLAYLMPARISARDSVPHRGGDASRAAGSTYTVINLNAFIKSSGVTIYPLALNNPGQIVGSSSAMDGNGDNLGYIIAPSGANGPLAALTGSYCCTFVDFPVSINNNGTSIVGYEDYSINDPSNPSTSVGSQFWTLTGPTSNTITSSVYQGGGFYGVANQSIAIAGITYATSQSSGTVFPIASCPMSDFNARGIDDAGVIVGSSGQPSHAAVLTLGGCPTNVPNAGVNSQADAVASNGDMILFTSVSGPSLWAKGRVYPIPLLSGYDASQYYVDPISLNASDVVVGNVVKKTDGSPATAFVYMNGTVADIATLFPSNSGWMPPFAVTGINDNGEIIGEGYLNNAQTPFALTK